MILYNKMLMRINERDRGEATKQSGPNIQGLDKWDFPLNIYRNIA
jgi:hypothetical protein